MTTITYKGEPKTVVGTLPTLNQAAPKFSLKNINGDTITNDTYLGKKVLISVFPDINTSVCDLQTKHMYDILSKEADITILNVSNNSIDDLKSWCIAQSIEMEMLVDPDKTFADAYGVWMPDFNKLARSLFVLDEKGTLTYLELVNEMATEPDYNEALKHLK